MIAATQMIQQDAGVPSLPGGRSASAPKDIFQALYSIISASEVGGGKGAKKTEGDGGPPDSDKTDLTACMELIAALCQNIPTDLTGDAKAPEADGAAVAGALEGNNFSGDKDIAALLSGLQSSADTAETPQTVENETIMARMPQILELLNATGVSTAKDNAAAADGGLCPLESAGEAAVHAAAPSEVGTANRSQPTDTGELIPAAGVPAATAKPETGEDHGTDADGKAEKAETSPPIRAKEAPSGHEAAAFAVSKEQFQAPAQDVPGTGTAENSVTSALRELDNILSSYDGQEDRQFHIQLEPENLGKLSISLSMGRNGLTARIGTQSAEVQSALSGQVGELINKLGSSGIQVQRMDVFCADAGAQQNNGHSGEDYSGRQYSRRKSGAAGRRTDIGEINAYGLCSQLEGTESSVEYLI